MAAVGELRDLHTGPPLRSSRVPALTVRVTSALGALLGLTLAACAFGSAPLARVSVDEYGDVTTISYAAPGRTLGWVALGAMIGLVLVSILTAVAYVIWLYRVTENAARRGSAASFGKGWAIGGWFVPILSYYVPYAMTRDAWRNGVRTRSNELSPATIPWWWGSLVLAWWVVPLLVAVGMGLSHPVPGLVMLGFAGLVAAFPSLLCYLVVTEVDRRQQ